MENKSMRNSFSGRIGYVLAAAGASVGLGNIWRFPYLAAKYGGGIFLLIYIALAATFGYTMMVAETAIGRSTRKSPVGAFRVFSGGRLFTAGGWLNALIPIIIAPYYSVIGGWVLKYLYEYLRGHSAQMADDGFFSAFIQNGVKTEFWFIVFMFCTILVILMGVENGIERVSRFMMPVLVVLAMVIALYSITRPGAFDGVKYLFVPDPSAFSWKTLIAAMTQMFYSLSIAMGILITFGSYMKREVSIEGSTWNVVFFDTLIAILSALMIIPAVFSYSGGDPKMLNAGPALMFITMPKIFLDMEGGALIAILFFLLVFFAALTSSIALAEAAAATFVDELKWSRKGSALFMSLVMLTLGSLSALGYGPLSGIRFLGMQFLDFFDFITNSIAMPISAFAICAYVVYRFSVKRVSTEVKAEGAAFHMEQAFDFLIRTICPLFAILILLFSIAGMLGFTTL